MLTPRPSRQSMVPAAKKTPTTVHTSSYFIHYRTLEEGNIFSFRFGVGHLSPSSISSDHRKAVQLFRYPGIYEIRFRLLRCRRYRVSLPKQAGPTVALFPEYFLPTIRDQPGLLGWFRDMRFRHHPIRCEPKIITKLNCVAISWCMCPLTRNST